MKRIVTPSQTVGPYLKIGLEEIAPLGSQAEHVSPPENAHAGGARRPESSGFFEGSNMLRAQLENARRLTGQNIVAVLIIHAHEFIDKL